MNSKKPNLQQIFAESIADDNLKTQYGTNITEYMSQDQSKKLKEKMNELINEFSQIDKSRKSLISFNELILFFNERNVNK